MLSPVNCGVCMDLAMKFYGRPLEPEVAQGEVAGNDRPELGDCDGAARTSTYPASLERKC
jgi:hypothetical protein